MRPTEEQMRAAQLLAAAAVARCGSDSSEPTMRAALAAAERIDGGPSELRRVIAWLAYQIATDHRARRGDPAHTLQLVRRVLARHDAEAARKGSSQGSRRMDDPPRLTINPRKHNENRAPVAEPLTNRSQ